MWKHLVISVCFQWNDLAWTNDDLARTNPFREPFIILFALLNCLGWIAWFHPIALISLPCVIALCFLSVSLCFSFCFGPCWHKLKNKLSPLQEQDPCVFSSVFQHKWQDRNGWKNWTRLFDYHLLWLLWLFKFE